MAKKEKTPLTFEELAREKERKEKKAKLFSRTFLKAFALFASFAIIFFAVMIAFVPETTYQYEDVVIQNAPASSGTSTVTPASTTPTPAAPASTDSNTPADTDNKQNETPADGNNQGETPAQDDVLTVFNEAINKVKSEATVINHTRGGSKTIDGVDPIDASSKLPPLLSQKLANTVINMAMGSNGVKDDGKQIGSADFPVKDQAYSSQLTADDVASATRNGNVITIVIKDDALGEADNGHNQKAINVIKANDIMSNIPDIVSRLVKVENAKTSAKNGTIVATLDDNGHIVAADYSFDWDIELYGSGLDAILHLASEEHYTMTY